MRRSRAGCFIVSFRTLSCDFDHGNFNSFIIKNWVAKFVFNGAYCCLRPVPGIKTVGSGVKIVVIGNFSLPPPKKTLHGSGQTMQAKKVQPPPLLLP